MSNIEAKFDTYLDSLTISRARKDRAKTHWNQYLRFIKERLHASGSEAHQNPLKPAFVSAFVDQVSRKFPTDNRSETIRSSFDRFRSYLARERHVEKNRSDIQKEYTSLLLRYLSDLDHRNASSATIRNYQADLLQSFLYLSSSYKDHDIRREKRLPDLFDTGFQIHMKNTLGLSENSIRRKISTMHSFVHWAQKNGYFVKVPPLPDVPLTANITKDPIHATDLASSGKRTKIKQGAAFVLTLICAGLLLIRLTSGVRTPPIQSGNPVPAGSVLRFEGRLSDQSGNAILEKRNGRFRLWDDHRDGTALYDSQECVIEPNQNGIFSVLIGSSCGKNIPANLLTGHLPLYLGITLGDEEELSPRQAIATISLTENSLKLGGLQTENPASIMSIPYINANGRLSISAASPIVESQKGVFTLEGQSMVLRTAERTGGSITLSPDDLGTVDIVFTDSLGRDSAGMMNIRNRNMITGTLLNLRGSLLTTGYNFIDLQSGNDAVSRFRVDAAGNTTIGGSLSIENVLEASSGGILMKTDVVGTGLNYDGGLGVYGSKGNPIPIPFDFTQATRIEFGFRISSGEMHADINLSEDRLKFYRLFWNPDTTMGIAVCTPNCSTKATSILLHDASVWHHGYIEYSAGSLHWNIDNNKAKVSIKESGELPAIQKGYVRFADTLQAISQLRISQSDSTILSAANSQIGGSLVAAGNIMSDGQIRTGNFSGDPTTAGSGATYFNTTDNMLYYWNGTSWVSDAFWKREGNSLYPHPLYAANLNLGIGTTSPQSRVHIQDSTQEQLRLSWDTTHYARFLASSSGTLAIDPTGDLLIAGDMSVGSGGVFYPSENGTHAQQSQYYLTADTSAGGQIRTNALGFGASGSDFAEVFITEEPVEVGDVVSLAFQQNQQSVYSIAKSTVAYSDKIIGVVTDRAAFVGGLNNETFGKPTATVGILGRVPIHVSGENGPIRRGDPLASSSRAGYAMRATERGPVIARALEDFPGTDSTTEATIVSFVQASWFEPADSLESAKNMTLDDKTVHLPGKTEGFGRLLIEHAAQDTVAGIESTGNATISATVDRDTPSATTAFVPSTESMRGNFPLKVTETVTVPPDLRLDSLFVIGSTTLADTAIAGQLFVDGSLLLADNSISSFSDRLSLTAQQAISLMGDRLIVDAQGNLSTTGWLIARKGIMTNLISSDDGDIMIDLSRPDDHGNRMTDPSVETNDVASLPRIGGQADTIDASQSFGTLMVKGEGNAAVTTIDAIGNLNTHGTLTASAADIRGILHAQKISLDETPVASVSANDTITAADHFISRGIHAPAIYAVSSAGSATIPAGSHELYIYYGGISDNSLIYITPTSTTQNRTLFVADTKSGSHAVIGLDVAISTPIRFNWWIIN